MRQRRLLTLAAPLVVATLALSACGSSNEEEPGANTGSSGAAATKTAKIGLIAPLSGELSALGLGMKNAVDLAINQANEANRIPGWKLEFAPEDDTAKPDVGAQVATKLTSDREVVGVVGTLNSSVAQAVQPVLNRANIVMVSPANTGPALTQGTDPANKTRPFKSYFRTATTDAIQGPFAAQYVLNTLGVKEVVVVHDKKTYGQGLTDAFKAEFTKGGGKVLSTETINPGDKDFSGIIGKILPLNPKVVYYGGEFPEASLLSNQLKAKGYKGLVMGGDGIYSGKYISTGKTATEGDLATSVGAPTAELESAKKFVADYEAASYSEVYEAYGAYAFDAANAIIEALVKVLPGKNEINDSVRSEVVTAMGSVSLDGATGKVAFDEFGDTTTKVLTVYKVDGGEWKPEKTDEFK